ncbi:hypothetical protein E6H24_05425 [Candidatus Bathyarchaeota archaeon]|nr:MAG: hypothetical protein E6H24_05425 [Candidatus Bathyarchaeota archaeon]
MLWTPRSCFPRTEPSHASVNLRNHLTRDSEGKDEGETTTTPTVPSGKPPRVHVCPECSSVNLIEDFDQGETICQDCGLVLSQNLMSRGPEWRAFTKEEKDERGRVGIPTSFSIHDKGLSTVIDRVNRDAYGRQLPMETRMEMLRLRKWQIRTRVHSSSDRNLAQAMAELDRLTDKLHVPANVKENSAVVYRKALDSGLVRGRSIAAMTQQSAIKVLKDAKRKGVVAGKDPMGLAAAALYVACVLENEKKTQKEIAEIANVTEVTVRNRYKGLKDSLGLSA